MEPYERVLSRCEIGLCWLWQGSKTSTGYGNIRLNGGWGYVHRVVWEGLVGPIPPDHHIDHLCRVKHCVNPDHLEPVTQAENNLRARRLRMRSLCRKGHPLSGDNLRIVTRKNGSTFRSCVKCTRESGRQSAKRAYWKQKGTT